ncbi:HipA N-terminal domain-containing protein [Lapillicoccus sp.]|uniref:HipA N-terminal domain-containing protein n=1 Tax=Lapillicoccus sp. TaxID=1909287 RepID=UPI0025E02924|nr:HipA N-terminal domain-containing protein [Lapillicoccus sp.]
MTLLDVSLDGVRAGQLEQRPGGTLSFTYDADYASRPSPTPLSLSMPLSARRHGNRVVSAWLEGLLPDNLAVREEWGRRFQVSARNPFAAAPGRARRRRGGPGAPRRCRPPGRGGTQRRCPPPLRG